MRLFLTLTLLFFLSSCQKDSTYFKPTPQVTLQVNNITATTCELSGAVEGNVKVVRGFIISAYNIPDFYSDYTFRIYCDEGYGTYKVNLNLTPDSEYWVKAFCFYPTRADEMGFSELIKFKTKE